MKKSGIWIIIIIILIAIFWYYCDTQKKEFELEKKLAVTEAVSNAVDSLKEHRSIETPPVKTIVIYKEAKEVKKKEEPKKIPVAENVFTDERDGQQYKYIEVEGLLWMARNLNYAAESSWCYENNDENCKKWGRLYTWDAAMKSCPEGWRLPNDEEWNSLISYYGGSERAGHELKEGGSSGFNALKAGYRDKKGFFGKAGVSAYFWSATDEDEHYASFKGLYKGLANVGEYTYTKPSGFSVRCVKDK